MSEPAIQRLLPAHCGHKQASVNNTVAGTIGTARQPSVPHAGRRFHHGGHAVSPHILSQIRPARCRDGLPASSRAAPGAAGAGPGSPQPGAPAPRGGSGHTRQAPRRPSEIRPDLPIRGPGPSRKIVTKARVGAQIREIAPLHASGHRSREIAPCRVGRGSGKSHHCARGGTDPGNRTNVRAAVQIWETVPCEFAGPPQVPARKWGPSGPPPGTGIRTCRGPAPERAVRGNAAGGA